MSLITCTRTLRISSTPRFSTSSAMILMGRGFSSFHKAFNSSSNNNNSSINALRVGITHNLRTTFNRSDKARTDPLCGFAITKRGIFSFFQKKGKEQQEQQKEQQPKPEVKQQTDTDKQQHQQHPKRTLAKPTLPGIKHIVAVASGKGGVGKSTTAVNLALALSHAGKRVGLLDADIYGPSIHRMMNLSGKPDVDPETRFLIPKSNYGIKCMSMGLIVQEDSPMIWRGPMVMSALEQLLRQVSWGELDIMVVDLPPGTGDAQLTISQRVPLSGAVIVSTPQDIALIDARRGTNMFRQVDVPILGIVENMSYFACPGCGQVSHVFGHHGARETAKEMGIDFLGEVPLHMDIRETSDSGRPITVSNPDSPQAMAYAEIAKEVLRKLEDAEHAKKQEGPKIIIE